MKKVLLSLALVVGMLGVGSGAIAFSSSPALAANGLRDGLNATGGSGAKNNNLGANIQRVTNVLLFILGAVAVIMIIIGGFRFIAANGDQSQVKAGRETILYAVIGLVVALLAYAIVNFVVNQFAK